MQAVRSGGTYRDGAVRATLPCIPGAFLDAAASQHPPPHVGTQLGSRECCDQRARCRVSPVPSAVGRRFAVRETRATPGNCARGCQGGSSLLAAVHIVARGLMQAAGSGEPAASCGSTDRQQTGGGAASSLSHQLLMWPALLASLGFVNGFAEPAAMVQRCTQPCRSVACSLPRPAGRWRAAVALRLLLLAGASLRSRAPA